MKKPKTKKIANILLVIALLINSAMSAYAKDPVLVKDPDTVEKKEDLLYEKGSINDLFNSTLSRGDVKELIYTYTQNGVRYRVYDTANSDLTYTNSFIYRIGANDEEILIRVESVSVENNVITTTITENGKTSVDVLNLDRNDRTKAIDPSLPQKGHGLDIP